MGWLLRQGLVSEPSGTSASQCSCLSFQGAWVTGNVVCSAVGWVLKVQKQRAFLTEGMERKGEGRHGETRQKADPW